MTALATVFLVLLAMSGYTLQLENSVKADCGVSVTTSGANPSGACVQSGSARVFITFHNSCPSEDKVVQYKTIEANCPYPLADGSSHGCVPGSCGGHDYVTKSITVPAGQDATAEANVSASCGAAQADIHYNDQGQGVQIWSDSGCQTTHNICKNQACVSVPVSEQGTACTQNSDCNPQHKACVNLACVLVNGAGSDTCSQNSDCNPQHKACVDQACVLVPGAGSDSCSQNSDCQPTTHKACVNNSCSLISGPGSDSCSSDNDCQTHHECRNNACTVVSGSGSNSCSSDNDCQTHHECRNNNSCVVVSGSGSNQCNVDGDCVPATHLTCQNNACVTVSGSGVSSCNNDNDCRSASQFSVCDSLSVSPNSGNVSLNVTANLSGHTQNGGSINQYRFNFGDGTGDTVQSGSSLGHVYSNPGTFVVNGYVIDNNNNQAGGSGACQKTVVVSSPQVLSSKAPSLPKTGPEADALVALASFGGIGVLLRRIRPSEKTKKA